MPGTHAGAEVCASGRGGVVGKVSAGSGAAAMVGVGAGAGVGVGEVGVGVAVAVAVEAAGCAQLIAHASEATATARVISSTP